MVSKGQRSVLRKALFRLRESIPSNLRTRVWAWTLRRIFARKGFLDENPSLFCAIELETRTRCNSTCGFCMASVLTDTREDLLMPDGLLNKIFAELQALKYDGVIRFFVNNEPLLDKRLVDLIRQAKAQIPAATLEVQTNGLKLNPRNGRELLDAGLDVLYVNNYSADGSIHKGVTAFLEETAPDFPDRKILFNLRDLNEKLLNRAGTAPNSAALAEPFSIPCVLPFEEMVITADGRVSLCCQDHFFEEKMGNVNESSLEDIWNGPSFQRIRKKLKESDRNGSKFCQVCDFRGFKEEHILPGESFLNRIVGPM